MSERGERGWLGQAVGFCARSAAAYKAAFMLAREAEVERQTLRRCRERYDLLERLLSRLGEAGVAPQAMRATLDRFATTPIPYRGAEEALDEAGGADRLLASLLASAGCHSLASRIHPDGRAVGAAEATRTRLDGAGFTTALRA
jgi:hypothetical protein